MPKILITGAGSVQSNGVINSLLKALRPDEEVVGTGSDPMDLALCKAARKYWVPYSTSPGYREALLQVLDHERPDMIHFQHDLELYEAMRFRADIEARGVKMLVPDNEVIDTCVHKHKSWLKFKAAGVPVPENLMIGNEADLERAFKELGDAEGRIWLRSVSIGAGGKGSFPAKNLESARDWIDKNGGWGDFAAAEMLTPDSITWLSIWQDGELIVAQTRRRRGWAHASRSISGVTGVTKVGETCSYPEVDDIAQRAIKAVTGRPHGIFGVDMTFDRKGVPNPTEINISRFFATILFFTEAGLNMPVMLKDLCLYGRKPELAKKLNPLPDGLLWLRGMDSYPRLTTADELDREIIRLGGKP